MFVGIPEWQVYVGGFVIVFVVAMLFLWIYNRREKRRKHAVQLSLLMSQWGMGWLSNLYIDYAVGDYSGIVYRVKQVVEAVRSDKAMVEHLFDTAKRVCEYCVENDKAKADELRSILNRTESVEEE